MTLFQENRTVILHAQNDLRMEATSIPEPGIGQVLVHILAGGICGSDLHYWQDGGIGTIRVREPIILGHEASGRIVALGEGVKELEIGQLVALNPSTPCGECDFCNRGLSRHCLKMRFKGSAMYVPHEQGMFRDILAINAKQCFAVSEGILAGAAACAEPLAVCLHAANRGEEIAGPLHGKTVLVTGAGPIGALCVAVARQRGASTIIVTDIQDTVLDVARKMGADHCINMAVHPDGLAKWQQGKGCIDFVFECSAAARAIQDAVTALRPLGTFVQVGVAGLTPLPLNAMVAKEIYFVGSHRFEGEFADAVHLISTGAIDPSPIITATYPISDVKEAFQIASDRSISVKVQLSFAAACPEAP